MLLSDHPGAGIVPEMSIQRHISQRDEDTEGGEKTFQRGLDAC